MRQLLFQQIAFDLPARHAEHRPDDRPALRRDAAETAQRGAAHQIQKHRLRIVVGVVRRGDRAAETLQKGVAQLPRCLLHAFAGLTRTRGHVAAGNGQRHAEPFTQRTDERLVAVGFRTAQAVVIMRGADGDFQLAAQRQQAYQHGRGIRAAGDGAADLRARLKQPLFAAPGENLTLHASIRGRRRS